MTHEEFEAFRYLERPSGPPVKVPAVDGELNTFSNIVGQKGAINITSHDGEINFGTIHAPIEMVREAIRLGVTIHRHSDSVTLNLGHESGISIHIHIED